MTRFKWCTPLFGWLCLAGAAALAQSGPATERQRVADERAAVEARFKEQEAACQQRFAVTDCVNAAKKERRDALAPLRRLDAALDDAQRKQRAAERREDVARKLEAAQAPEREAVVRQAGATASAASAPAEAASASVTAPREVKPAPPPRRQNVRPPRPERPSEAERRASEAAAEARSAARKQAAQDHREAVEQRNAQRALRGKKVEPLPVPASGSLP